MLSCIGMREDGGRSGKQNHSNKEIQEAVCWMKMGRATDVNGIWHEL